ncbi:MAG TPA: DUF6152 family protein, partial [Gammaproteobacteria bacterium]|nr:DUF6152 family protein [Gammaproteobacteria bacterium]
QPLFLTAAAAVLMVAPAYGHHSDAALNMDTTLTLEGTVTEFSLRNPHAYFVMTVAGEDGQAQDWTVQMGSMITLRRRGWSPDSLQVGDQVTASLHPARDGRLYGLVTTVEKDGKEIGTQVPGETQRGFRVGADVPRATSVEGRWIVDRSSLPPDYPGGLDQITLRDLRLTERGRLAMSSWTQDLPDNPELNCIAKPTPAMIIYTDLYPIEFTDNGDDTLTIRSQYFDELRTVYMDGRAHPDATVLMHEGHSVGHYEGDTLVIDTRNFAAHRSPYQNGIPSGSQKHVIERYRLIDDGVRMEVEFLLEDPEYIVGSMTHKRILFYRPDTNMDPFNCDLESTRRYLPSNLSSE